MRIPDRPVVDLREVDVGLINDGVNKLSFSYFVRQLRLGVGSLVLLLIWI